MNRDSSRSPWLWAFWGCGGCLLVTGVVLVLLIFAGVRAVENIDRELNDPVAREEKVKDVLGIESLPEGYHPVLAFSVPFVFDTVLLADTPLDERGEFLDDPERVFVYVELLRGNRQWRQYTEDGDPSDVLEEQGIRMPRSEEIGRGRLESDGQEIDYVSQRGSIEIHDHDFEGISTFLFIQCPGSKRMRVGVWTTPDPHEGIPVADADFSGTGADPEQVRAFLSHFDFCGT